MAGEDIWSIYRRYSRFRELHQDLKGKFPQISALEFPPKKILGNRSEKVVAERRKLLEVSFCIYFCINYDMYHTKFSP